MRKVKGSIERKKELLNIALNLFYLKGYENTSINDILQESGIAKGTFYYYFKSKEELLDIIVNEQVNGMLEILKPIIIDNNKNAVEKLNCIIKTAQDYRKSTMENRLKIFNIMEKMDNLIFKYKLTKTIVEKSHPLIKYVILQGNNEGIFNVKYIDEATEFYIHFGNQFNYQLSKLILDTENEDNAIKIIQNKILFFQDTLEKILGLEKDKLNFSKPILNMLSNMIKIKQNGG